MRIELWLTRLYIRIKGALMKVLICGSRGYTDEDLMRRVFKKLIEDGMRTLITGGARGADRMAEKLATEFGIPNIVIPAKWNEYGKAAGVIRNSEMLKLEPDLVVAFFNGTTPGTRDMVKKASDAGVRVDTIWSNDSKIKVMSSTA